jgi:hypothetical protein
MTDELTEFLIATVIVIIIVVVVVVSIDNCQSSTDLGFVCSFLHRASRLLVH